MSNFKTIKFQQLMAQKRREKERILEEWGKSDACKSMIDSAKEKMKPTIKPEDLPF